MNYLTKWFQKFNANGESDALIAKLQRDNAELGKKLKDALDSYNKEAAVSQGYKKANEQLCREVYEFKQSLESSLREINDIKKENETLKQNISILEDVGRDQVKENVELYEELCDKKLELEETKKKNVKKKNKDG